MDETKIKKTRLIKKAVAHTNQSEIHPQDKLFFRIEHRAYELHIGRGFQHGYDFDDWVQAEREILSRKPPV